MTNDLDTFEAQLLSELRTAVAARAEGQPLSGLAPVRGKRRRIAAAAATAAAAIVAAIVVPSALGDPAYAVQDGPSGSVDVKVNRLEDAAGLQRALVEHGVKADVQFLGDDLRCTPGRFRDAVSASGSSTRFSVGTALISVELDRRDVAHGETVVIAASRISNGISAEVGIADGPVRDCRPIPLSRGNRS